MKLDKEQIRHIKDFVRARGFTWYDVQLEIIDHVACKVEDLMTANSALTLDAAIAQTHAGFGVMGFSVVEDSMTASLQKRYWKLFRSTFVSYFNWKLLPLMAGFVYLCYIASKAINAPVMLINITWIVVFAAIIIYCGVNYRTQQRHKKMLTAQMGNIIAIMVNIPIQLFNIVNIFTKHTTNAGLTGIVLGIFLSITIAGLFTFRDMQRVATANCRELEEQYELTVGG
jgi:hypothetical protein